MQTGSGLGLTRPKRWRGTDQFALTSRVSRPRWIARLRSWTESYRLLMTAAPRRTWWTTRPARTGASGIHEIKRKPWIAPVGSSLQPTKLPTHGRHNKKFLPHPAMKQRLKPGFREKDVTRCVIGEGTANCGKTREANAARARARTTL